MQMVFGTSFTLMRTNLQILDIGEPKGRPAEYSQTLPSLVGELLLSSIKAKPLMKVKLIG